MFGGGRSRQRQTFGVFMLMMEIYSIGSQYIPPITLYLVIIQTFLYLDFFNFFPEATDGCLSVVSLTEAHVLKKFVFSSLLHATDMHLYYNMLTFIYKGIQMEPYMRRDRYIFKIAFLVVCSQLILLGFNYFMYVIFNSSYYLNMCTLGFSAVLFGLKTISFNSEGETIPVMRYSLFLDLIVIQFINYYSSFWGHLAGIAAGLLLGTKFVKKLEDSVSRACDVFFD